MLGLLEYVAGWWRHARHVVRDDWHWYPVSPAYQGRQVFACTECQWTKVS